MKILQSLLFFLMASPTGCAFHPSGENAPGKSQAQSAGPAALIRVAWWVDGSAKSPLLTRSLKIDQQARVMRSDSPVTLPAVVPDRLEIELSYPTALAELVPDGVSLQAVSGNDRPVPVTPKRVMVSSKTEELTDAMVEIEGVRLFLADGAEAAIQLRILIQRPSGETPLTAIIDLRTPPSLLQFSQGMPTESDFEGLSAGPALRRLEIMGKRYDLLQVSRMKNLSSRPIQVTVPIQSSAVLNMTRKTYAASPAGACSFSENIDQQIVELTTETKLLILSDDLPRAAIGLGAAQPLTIAMTREIAPGEEVRVGIFGTGVDSSALVDGKFAVKRPGSVQVPHHCESKCSKMRMGAEEFPLCWDATRRRQPARYPADKVARCMECAAGVAESCTVCRSWEENEQPYAWAGPNCLFCGDVIQLGNIFRAIPGWSISPVMAEMPSGEEDGDFSVVSAPAKTPLLLRFAELSENDDPETRILPFLSGAQPYGGAR